MSVDFQAEGLAEGLDGPAREARLSLLRELHDEGVALEELRAAVEENRLVLLPVERALEGEGERMSLREIAERVEVPAEYLARQRQALGVSVDDPDEPVGGEGDLTAARHIAKLLEAGLPEDGLLEVSRVLGMSMSQLAAANRSMIAQALVGEDADEHEAARRLEGAARFMLPMLGEMLEYVLRLHIREQIRQDVLAGAGPDFSGQGTEITAGFADLVGFTRLGERLPVDELGAVTGRLTELAGDVASGPVRLVKQIGDGVMLVSADNDALLEAALELVAAAEEAGGDFPQLRAGVARGRALPRGGDWYGRPVNAASRITDVARPGSVLASEQSREAAGEGFRFSFAGERRLKGMKGPVKLFRVRPAEPEGG